MNSNRLITVVHPHNQVIINRIHISHHGDLVRGFLLPSVRDQKEPVVDTGSVEEDAILRELGDTYLQWAVAEVLRFGYLSLYHLWERQIVSLLEDQLARRGRCFERSPGALTTRVRSALFTEFSASFDDSLWNDIDRSRRLANEIKHGPKSSNGAGDAEWVAISEKEFDDLAASLERFWDELPYRVEYSDTQR